jgi:hypothetical protein
VGRFDRHVLVDLDFITHWQESKQPGHERGARIDADAILPVHLVRLFQRVRTSKISCPVYFPAGFRFWASIQVQNSFSAKAGLQELWPTPGYSV